MRAQRKLTAVALTILFSAGVAFAGTSRVEPKGLWDSLMSLISSPTLENVGGAITRPGTQNVGGAAPTVGNVGGAGPVAIDRPGTQNVGGARQLNEGGTRANAVGHQNSPVGTVIQPTATVGSVGH